MKTRVALLLLIFCIIKSFGQTERESYKIAAGKFQNYFNSEKYDSIYQSFSSEMQNALSLDKTKEFLSSLKDESGKITKMDFVKYQATYASYKTTFERSVFTVNISVDNNSKIDGLFVKPFEGNTDNQPEMERNKTSLSLPFKGEWTVFWGGDIKELNYHVVSKAQRNAFDIVIMDKEGKSFKSNGNTNENYYAFGQELIAPCDADVVQVIDGVKDNEPGKMNPFNAGGNMVVLKTLNNEFLVFCHFKHKSIKVKEGDKVLKGQLLGLCGNTGNSSEPHLHFHIQNVEDINVATGVKCYFDKISVNGQVKTDYSPVKGEKIMQTN